MLPELNLKGMKKAYKVKFEQAILSKIQFSSHSGLAL